MNYKSYYDKLRSTLGGIDSTPEITKKIETTTEEIFRDDFDKKVLYSTQENHEFLYDVSVLTFESSKIVDDIWSNGLDNQANKYEAFLLLESELGGVGATSARPVIRNTLEDFSKLLIGNSKYKIMIAAISSYENETDYVDKRLDTFAKVYQNSSCNSELLLIFVEGNHTKGNSRQIKLDTSRMHGYILKNGTKPKIEKLK